MNLKIIMVNERCQIFLKKKKMRVYKIPFIETSRNCKTKVMKGSLWLPMDGSIAGGQRE